MFTKKQHEEFEELTTPLINWIKKLDQDVVIIVDGAEATLNVPALVNMDSDFVEMAAEIDDYLDAKEGKVSEKVNNKLAENLN